MSYLDNEHYTFGQFNKKSFHNICVSLTNEDNVVASVEVKI